jgi:hypothetical protein
MIPKKITEKLDETYTVTDFNVADENTHHAGGKKEHRHEEDEEEDEEMGGGRQVRCNHQ